MDLHRIRALALLTGTGALVAVILALGKAARATGISSLAFTFWMDLGAGLLLLPLGMSAIRQASNRWRLVRFGLVAGLLSNALPIATLMIAVPHIGTGLASVVYAFPPLFTYVLSLVFRIEKMQPRRIGAIVVGFIGGLLIVLPPDVGTINVWMALAILTPAFLGCANVYRTIAWPSGARPTELAAFIMLGAATTLLPVMAFFEGVHIPIDHQGAKWMWLAMFVMAVMYSLNMKLQKLAGPVYLSQLGYVSIPTGLIIGALFFQEHWPRSIWFALMIIACGLYLMTMTQKVTQTASTSNEVQSLGLQRSRN